MILPISAFTVVLPCSPDVSIAMDVPNADVAALMCDGAFPTRNVETGGSITAKGFEIGM
jgi:hypothetical protein